MRRSNSLLTSLICVAVLLTAIKFFTEEVALKDDPTVALRARAMPSITNFSSVDTLEQPGHYVLARDENELVFSDVYRGIVGWGWIVALILAAGYGAASRRR